MKQILGFGLLLTLLAAPAQAGTHHLTVAGAQASSGEMIEIPVTLETTEELAGWSFGIEHDPAVLELAGVVNGSAVFDQCGVPPDYLGIDLYPTGYTVGVIISFLGMCTLPPGAGYELSVGSYFQFPDAPVSSTQICPTGDLGSPPVAIVFVTNGSTHEQILTCGEVTIGPTFIRGDCNGTGVLDIADAIYILNYLFVGAAAPTCLDACDASDGGTFDLADSVAILEALFLGVFPLDAPFPSCGGDPTADPLDCQGSAVCP